MNHRLRGALLAFHRLAEECFGGSYITPGTEPKPAKPEPIGLV
jgi:hypothetical protein